MKEIADAIMVFFIGSFVLILLFGPGAFNKYLDTYNTQKDREMFLKSYEMVMDCRKNSSLINIDKVCGELPTFTNKVP